MTLSSRADGKRTRSRSIGVQEYRGIRARASSAKVHGYKGTRAGYKGTYKGTRAQGQGYETQGYKGRRVQGYCAKNSGKQERHTAAQLHRSLYEKVGTVL